MSRREQKPRLLDLFCGAGGAAMGYHRAGFEVVGVDIEPQPNYPFEFWQDDALELLTRAPTPEHPGGWWDEPPFDAIHASPPCQAYSKARDLQGNKHPDLIGPVRELLRMTALPWVIENVKGSPLRNAQVLEGQMFGLNLHRPRLFETSWGYEAPLLRSPPPRQAKMGRPPKNGEAVQPVGNFSGVAQARRDMETPWMNQQEMREAIPPAYTEHIGHYLMEEVRRIRAGVAA
jgi:DNA (cytosine-5)-methyltransferase 1